MVSNHDNASLDSMLTTLSPLEYNIVKSFDTLDIDDSCSLARKCCNTHFKILPIPPHCLVLCNTDEPQPPRQLLDEPRNEHLR